MAHNAEHAAEPPRYGPVSLDELARRKHVRPISSPDDLAQDDVFDTDEELDAFLAHVHATVPYQLGNRPVSRDDGR